MYTTNFLEKIGVTGAIKYYINESLDNLDTNRVINTLMTLEYDESSVLDLILRLINNEEALI